MGNKHKKQVEKEEEFPSICPVCKWKVRKDLENEVVSDIIFLH